MTWLGSSKIAVLASLLALPFAHEDLAIVLGACAIVNNVLPVGLVLVAIYLGMVSSDFALYGLGAAARRAPWLSRFADRARVERAAQASPGNMFWLVALCRLVPGMVFIAFVTCGWMRVSLRRFSVASLVISAIYLPVVLLVAIKLGGQLDVAIGPTSWPVLFVGFIGAGLMRKRLFGREPDEPDETAPAEAALGAPARPAGPGRVAPAERIPPLLFYAPLALSWFALAARHRSLTLPACANPTIPTGGMWGESKSSYFRQIAPDQKRWIADYAVLRRSCASGSAKADLDRALALAADAKIAFPLVAKPDIGWHGYGVQLIANADALERYIRSFPAGEKLILQRLAPYDGEAAVLYARLPGSASGRIESLAIRKFPQVVGDGCATVAELIARDPRARWRAKLHLGRDTTHCGLDEAALARVPAAGEVVPLAFIGNQRAGGLYFDARRLITPDLVARFDEICRGIPEFHYGRFDIRFDSPGALAAGEGFSIIEINGVGGEAIDVWDPGLSVAEVYRRLYRQQALLFVIGDRNRRRGFAPPGLISSLRPAFHQSQLIGRYPASS